MPAKSEAQRKMLNARFGHAWVKRHHYDNKGKLPEKVGSKVATKKKKPETKKAEKKEDKKKMAKKKHCKTCKC